MEPGASYLIFAMEDINKNVNMKISVARNITGLFYFAISKQIKKLEYVSLCSGLVFNWTYI